MEEVTLTNVCRGMAVQLFTREMLKVLENVADSRTPATAVRKIILEFTFKPDNDRHSVETEIQARSRLVDRASVKAITFFSLDHQGDPKATLSDATQLTLADQLKEAQEKKGEI